MSSRTRVSPLVVRPSDVAPKPWSDGLGATRVLAARPGWRISLVEMQGRMPFSPFIGADRLLIPLSPAGVSLEINGHASRVPRYSAVTFRGEDHVWADTGSGMVAAVDLMTRRSSGRLQWAIHRLSGAIAETADALVVLAGRVEARGETAPPGSVIRPGAGSITLTSSDAVIAVMRVWENRGAQGMRS
jgi:environmental stress-induced protein Ves